MLRKRPVSAKYVRKTPARETFALVSDAQCAVCKPSTPPAVRIAARQNIRSRPPPASRPPTSRSHLSGGYTLARPEMVDDTAWSEALWRRRVLLPLRTGELGKSLSMASAPVVKTGRNSRL
jgi:hypothetical protein